MSGWGCPEETNEYCQRLRRPCAPGQSGCVLHGAVRFLDPAKNAPRRRPDAEAERGARRPPEDDDSARNGW